MEEQLFTFERDTDRATIAQLLRDVADNLAAGEPVQLSAGEESITLDVPSQAEFEVQVERETEGDETELSVEFEIEWDETDGGDAPLSVE
ncbi:amphi-Trp domain-containing protein [Halosegnis longus]|uniref:Amphi-Trp domain-containing protein n=1 Tax=Halosegnis longus TaxID=2216012 RepID=A0AAJ4UVT7_9EURY|nr:MULTISPECIES: amphi-Trp domain-containing protein [Halobacteriales]RNJ26259.1 amphi-Trp domain-containing protein [Salella cibi]